MLTTANLGIVGKVLLCWCRCPNVWPVGFLAWFLPAHSKTGFEPMQPYFAFRRGQENVCSFVDLEDPFFHYCWRIGEVMRLADNRRRERMPEVDIQLVSQFSLKLRPI